MFLYVWLNILNKRDRVSPNVSIERMMQWDFLQVLLYLQEPSGLQL